MPIERNADDAEVDTGTGADTEKPNHMAPADRPAEDAVEEKAVDPAVAENKSVRASRGRKR